MKLSTRQIPAKQYPFAISHGEPLASEMRKQRDKSTTFSVGFAPPSGSHTPPDYLFALSNEAELLLSVEDSIVQLKALLGSPHAARLKGRAEALLVALRQLEELLSLLSRCQNTVSPR